MVPRDDAEPYTLPEAGRLLRTSPARLRRQGRAGRIPLLRGAQGEGVPRAWADAAGGRTATDEEALRCYWLERLAPPSVDARRPLRDRACLPAESLLEEGEVAARLRADASRLRRLDADGTLPALRVDGALRYDALLVDLLARAGEDEKAASGAERRRAEVRAWALFEYRTSPAGGLAPAPPEAPAAPANALAAAPRAWSVPSDLGPPPPPDGEIAAADGFEVVPEDP